ncbi:hypothetical protein [Roseisolibacter agri]|uniref:Uncharacterized protein n=1 Tax=Roseisolibacter agri TaxID=2014610 RepID=A0AA37V8Q6_9BACT|nr:hypothetical protein [Roseisolibacter agri]GLC28046.1 hypothetical protein rosag_45590 [Roseisolibacter agri]
MSRTFRSWPVRAAVLVTAACARGETAAVADSPTTVAAAVIDSVVPRDEELRRFRQGVDSVDALAGGAPSADALVRRFATALEARDTATLHALRIDRREFAWAYYPASRLARPPYDLSPALMWFQLEGNSGRGLFHALEERGGRPLRLLSHACPRVDAEGANRIHAGCTIRRLQAPGDTVQEQLFGAILERGGSFKFVSYSNRL